MINQTVEQTQRIARGAQRRVNGALIKLIIRQRGLAAAYEIPTFTVREELEKLFELACQCPPNARVLEVGSYLGASTCFLAAGLRGPDASILCVDTWQNQTMPDGIRDTLAVFEQNVKAFRQHLKLIRKPSSNVTPAELGEKFDLVFLDGDHSYQQTRSDFELASARVAPNGVLAFHDSLFFEGVSRVIGEALASARWQLGGIERNLVWIRPAQFTHLS